MAPGHGTVKRAAATALLARRSVAGDMALALLSLLVLLLSSTPPSEARAAPDEEGYEFKTLPPSPTPPVYPLGERGDGGSTEEPPEGRRYADRAPRERYRDHKPPPQGYVDGPLPHISDAFFSLIILIYVSVIFVFMFFSFCWKEPERPPPDPANKNIPMITSMLEEMEKQEQEAAAAAAAAAAEEEGGGGDMEEGGGGGADLPRQEDSSRVEHETHELQEKPLIERGNGETAGGGGGSSKVVKLPPIEKVVVNVEKKPGEEPPEAATQV